MTDWPGASGLSVPTCGPNVWLCEIMHAVALIAGWIIDPLFSAEGPVNVDAMPAWALATACAAFLTALTWAIRYIVVQGTAGLQRVYSNVIEPAGKAHIALMEALKDTREQDSASLKSLASSQDLIMEELSELRKKNG